MAVIIVSLSGEEYAVICGLAAGSQINADGIFSDAWDGLRKTFPLEDFEQAVRDGLIEYDERAGT